MKAAQHEQRDFVRWTDADWVVARRRLLLSLRDITQEHFENDGRPFGMIFDPQPEQLGLQGDPYVWAEMCDRLEGSAVPAVLEARLVAPGS